MPTQPSLPPIPYDVDPSSMLTRKFGLEVTNYFAGSPLNRLGFLRGDHVFLSRALKHPSTGFLLTKDLQPLIQPNTQPGHGKLHWVGYEDVKSIIGEDPYAKSEKEALEAYDSEKYVPQIIFLGVDEKKEGLEYQGKNLYKGRPFFAVDVTARHESIKDACEKLVKDQEEKGFEFSKGRVMDVEPHDAAIYAAARQLLDWNLRNPFCAGCGHPTMSVNAGFKRTCPPTDASLTRKPLSNSLPPTTSSDASGDKPNPNARPPCVTRQGVSNLCFPRTDPTVIMAVLNHAGDRILLGRSKRFPPHWFSALAGFAEPAESIEEAVRREVYEESGVIVGRVVIHSTQPWPYPANLMIGAIGQSVPTGETIDLGNDPELEDARWFTFEEVREALRVGTSGLGEAAGKDYKEGGLRIPPATAIANQLIEAVVNGWAGGAGDVKL